MAGWVSIDRKIIDNWIWDDKPFSRGQAWIDLILMANHKDNKFLLGSEIVNVERGCLITSELKLMDRWGWSKTKVRRFLELLQNDLMIVKNTDRKRTTITIVNYGLYQETETTERPQKDRRKTTKRPQKDTNNNDNNDNNIYKYIVEHLNEKSGSKYKFSSKATQKHINGRLSEGYNLDDFKTVIDKKVAEWKGTEMEKYLRPETLFGTKFEGYLNQKEITGTKPKSTNKFNQFPQRSYCAADYAEIEKKLINKGL